MAKEQKTDNLILFLMALGAVVFHILLNGQYGFHRDELDFIMNALPPTALSSLALDFERRKRVELEQITGAIVRRSRRLGVPTPGFDPLYAVLRARALDFGGVI